MTASHARPLRPRRAALLALLLDLVLGLLLGGFAARRLATPAPPREVRYTPLPSTPA